MAEREALTAAYVRSILHYDPGTGVFTWRERPREHFTSLKSSRTWNARFAGKTAGWKGGDGYFAIQIDGKSYLAHRLAWLYMTGVWPKDKIDHRDTERSNNIWMNLREATNSENGCNRCAPSTNTSGSKGVSWYKPRSKWRATITVRGNWRCVGFFDKREEAAVAYAKAAESSHGEFSRN